MGDEKSLAELVLEEIEKKEFFMSSEGEIFLPAKVGERTEWLEVGSRAFSNLAIQLGRKLHGKILRKDQLDLINSALLSKTMFMSIPKVEISVRAKYQNKVIYYDLNSDKGEIAKISQDGVEIAEFCDIAFKRNRNMKEQSRPDLSVDISKYIKYIEKHFNISDINDRILFAVYLPLTYIEKISKPVICVTGAKGSGKSTFLRKTSELIDPSDSPLKTMPRTEKDLSIILNNNYFVGFDNLELIKNSISNILCMASTGGSYEMRKLYTDADLVVLKLHRCVAINGIDDIVTKPDLHDRIIDIKLERIKASNRKTDEDLQADFKQDIPKIVGCNMIALSEAIKIVDEVKLEKYSRLADFTKWGYAIAEVLGIGGDVFMKAYERNKEKSSHELLLDNPLAQALMILMKERKAVRGSVNKLLSKLRKVALEEGIDCQSKDFPKQANVLSRRLNQIKSNLEKEGIYYDIANVGQHKEIRITNRKNIEK